MPHERPAPSHLRDRINRQGDGGIAVTHHPDVVIVVANRTGERRIRIARSHTPQEHFRHLSIIVVAVHHRYFGNPSFHIRMNLSIPNRHRLRYEVLLEVPELEKGRIYFASPFRGVNGKILGH